MTDGEGERSRNYERISASGKPGKSSSKRLVSLASLRPHLSHIVPEGSDWYQIMDCSTYYANKEQAALVDRPALWHVLISATESLCAHYFRGEWGKHRHARLCSINVRSRNFLSRKLNSQYCRVKQKDSPSAESSWWSSSCSLCYVYTKSCLCPIKLALQETRWVGAWSTGRYHRKPAAIR